MRRKLRAAISAEDVATHDRGGESNTGDAGSSVALSPSSSEIAARDELKITPG